MKKLSSYLKNYLWPIIGFGVMILTFYGLVPSMQLGSVQDNILAWLVLAEGVLLFCILILYVSQFQQVKIINAEKEETLDQMAQRIAAIEAAADGIAIMDVDGNLIYMNKALKSLHNISEDDIQSYIGKSWLNLYNEKGRIDIEEVVYPLLREQGHWRGEADVMRKDGKLISADMSLTLLDDGTMVGTARDLSDKQKSDAEKQAWEEQFYQAQKMEAVGRLAGGMAHDFNNVLAAIRGYAEFLDEDLDKSTPQRKFAQNILQACSQAKDLIDQILAFSRQKQSTKDSINLYNSFQETYALLKASIPKTIDVSTYIETEEAFIDGNPTQMTQLMMNLCVNASDSIESEHGEILLSLSEHRADNFDYPNFVQEELPKADETPRVSIKNLTAQKTRLLLGAIAKDQDYIALKVTDTGSGMSRAIMERIFEPFFTTKPVDKGTGLGLASVHGVVVSHRGALILESELNKGTSFELLFPKVKTKSNAKSAIDTTSESSQIRHGSILFVEDQPEVQAVMIKMMERMGHNVDVCDSGLEALQVMKDSLDYYDLVITDYNMPKMTGFELIEQVYLLDENVPFILLSGYSLEKIQDMIREHPAVRSVLRKPTPKDTLRDAIAQVLREKQNSKQAGKAA